MKSIGSAVLILITVLSWQAFGQNRAAHETPAAGPTPASVKLRFTIQVGAFKNIENAVHLAETLSVRQVAAFRYEADSGLHMVCIGQFPSREEALETARELKSAGMIHEYVIIAAKEKLTTRPVENVRTQPPESGPDNAGDAFEGLKGLTMESLVKSGKVQEISPGTVQIPPERQQLIGVRLGTVEKRTLQKIIRAAGRIDYDEKRIGIVSPKISGWIEDLYADFTGRFVKKGEPLLTLYSPELLSTQEDYLLALKAKHDWSTGPFAEVTEGGNRLAESARRRLKLWDISDAQIKALEETREPKKNLTLFSPYTGYVVEKMVSKGQFVDAGMTLFKIADMSVVWLIADIYEYELPLIRLGQAASLRLTHLPGDRFTGKVVYIYPSLDPRTRTAKVRIELPNPSGRLKPEMFADVELRADLGDRLAVPQSAVIDTGLRQIAIIDKGHGLFEPREVTLGMKVDDYVEVVKGLSAGERVVTSANFLIDSESKLKEAVEGMSAGGHSHH